MTSAAMRHLLLLTFMCHISLSMTSGQIPWEICQTPKKNVFCLGAEPIGHSKVVLAGGKCFARKNCSSFIYAITSSYIQWHFVLRHHNISEHRVTFFISSQSPSLDSINTFSHKNLVVNISASHFCTFFASTPTSRCLPYEFAFGWVKTQLVQDGDNAYWSHLVTSKNNIEYLTEKYTVNPLKQRLYVTMVDKVVTGSSEKTFIGKIESRIDMFNVNMTKPVTDVAKSSGNIETVVYLVTGLMLVVGLMAVLVLMLSSRKESHAPSRKSHVSQETDEPITIN
ncbi:hypothetical protein HDE_01898 [Halotydeus destructor]|nr:hypothetical protein HDE_01898 [Halotydeus destructor]